MNTFSANRFFLSTSALCLVFCALAVSCASSFFVQKSPVKNGPFQNGAVVSAEKHATLVGTRVLMRGGNAVDAAVTMGFALAVTLPRAGNLGGGGFMLIHIAESGKTVAIDYREKAPLEASEDMFLDEKGEVDIKRARESIESAGVPGTVAGLALALEKYGTISLAEALLPAIELAENGFEVSSQLHRSLLGAKKRMRRSEESMNIFFADNGEPPAQGQILKQENLAWSLKKIRDGGPDAFYRGAIAEKITTYMKRAGGLISAEDLASYKAVMRKPITGKYRGYQVYSMPPPSSGGLHLIQMLKILENHPLSKYKRNSPEYIHLLAETMKFAYADRSEHLGDPDFSEIPTQWLTSESYAKKLSKRIHPDVATPSAQIMPGNPVAETGTETTHFAVADKFGNVVSNTYTLNFSYGSGLSVPGTGILLNNEMDDFSAKPGAQNAYGLVGSSKNSIVPEKRMLSSMTPTIVLKDGNFFLTTGSPGGSRIITTVLQLLINVIDHKMNIQKATATPRIHHQWLPDAIYIENGMTEEIETALSKKGHRVERTGHIGNAQSIVRQKGLFHVASDNRKGMGAAMGY